MWMPSMPAEPEPVAAPAPILILDGDETAAPDVVTDPATLILTCANCGAAMDERKCKLICRCGYFLSCSDYY
jgi:hypothetical protein